MESNRTKKQSHGSGNGSNHHLEANCRSESDAYAVSTNREEGNEKKILFQIGGIASYEVYDDCLKADTEVIDGMQISMASTSPSLSSLSSASLEDMIELKSKEEVKSHESYENNQRNRSLSNGSSGFGELQESSVNNTPRSQSVVTNASVGPDPLSPTQSPPVQVMDREGYDPQRIPALIFERSGALEWSAASNESLFSLSIGDNSVGKERDNSLATDHTFRYSDFKPEEVPKSCELLTYSPSLPTHLEDSDCKTSNEEEQRSGVTETTTETDCEEKSTVPIVSWRDLSDSNNSDQTPTSQQSFSSPITKKSKTKNKTTTKSTKRKKKRCAVCCFSCGNSCSLGCCKNTRACCGSCRWPTTCHGGFSCCRWPKCLCNFSFCKWPRCLRDLSCCRWPKWSSCDCFPCRSCCSCHRCCCYSSPSLEIIHGEVRT